MDSITRKYGEKGRYTIKVDLANHYNDPIIAPISAIRKQQTIVDDTNPVNFDAARLALLFVYLRAKDFKYYFYIVARMTTNDRPVKVTSNEMRIALKEKYLSAVGAALSRLVTIGLLFKVEGKFEQYLINPAYAWRGNRIDYINTDNLPVVHP